MNLTELPSKKEAKDIGYQDVVAYFLYGGMIYIGLKNWRRAMDYLTYVRWGACMLNRVLLTRVFRIGCCIPRQCLLRLSLGSLQEVPTCWALTGRQGNSIIMTLVTSVTSLHEIASEYTVRN